MLLLAKIKVEQIAADVGQEIVDQVLAVGNGANWKMGTLVSGASVKATVVARQRQSAHFKLRRRKHYQAPGHRQQFTVSCNGQLLVNFEELSHGTEKGGGSTRNGRDSKPKMLG